MASSNIFSELKDSFIKPWKTLSFKLYFFFVIVLFGGMGVIVALYNAIKDKQWEGFAMNLITYSLAILVPAFISIFLQYYPISKNKVSLAILIVVIAVATPLLALWNSILIAIICVILAWVFWIIANSENALLDDDAYDKSIKQDLVEHGKDWN